MHWLSNRFDDSQANAMDWLQDEIKDAVYKLRSGDIQVKEIIWIVFDLGHAASFGKHDDVLLSCWKELANALEH